METITSADLRDRMRRTLNRVSEHGEHLAVRRHNDVDGVLVPPGWYERACQLMTSDAADNQRKAA